MKRTIFFTLIISVFLSKSVLADKWRVNNAPNADADFLELQAANDDFNVSAGDTVYMEGSTTKYNMTNLDKKLTIIGPGYFLGQNDSTQASKLSAQISHIYCNSGSEATVIMGMHLNYGTGSGVIVYANDVIIKRNRVTEIIKVGQSVTSCFIYQNYIEGRVYVSDNSNATIYNNVAENIEISSNSSALVYNNVFFNDNSAYTNTIHNSTFQSNIIIAADISDDATYNNDIRNNLFGRAASEAPVNGNQYSIDMSTVFVDFDGSQGYSDDEKWDLRDDPSNPAYDSGYNGDDCGAYFGNSPYVLSGMPPFPHIFDVDMPASVSKSSGLEVNVKIKSQN